MSPRRGGGAVERGGLESRFRGLPRTRVRIPPPPSFVRRSKIDSPQAKLVNLEFRPPARVPARPGGELVLNDPAGQRQPGRARHNRPNRNPDTASPPQRVRSFPCPNTAQAKNLTQAWKATHEQIGGGAMNGFVSSEKGASEAMGYYTPAVLPFAYSLASTFTLANRWFPSVSGPTYPNRRFLLAGTAFGGTATNKDELLDALEHPPPNGTIFDRLSPSAWHEVQRGDPPEDPSNAPAIAQGRGIGTRVPAPAHSDTEPWAPREALTAPGAHASRAGPTSGGLDAALITSSWRSVRARDYVAPISPRATLSGGAAVPVGHPSPLPESPICEDSVSSTVETSTENLYRDPSARSPLPGTASRSKRKWQRI